MTRPYVLLQMPRITGNLLKMQAPHTKYHGFFLELSEKWVTAIREGSTILLKAVQHAFMTHVKGMAVNSRAAASD